ALPLPFCHAFPTRRSSDLCDARTRRLRGLGAGAVPHTTHGRDDRGTVGILLNLCAQALHVHVDQPGVGLVLVAPHFLEQHFTSEDRKSTRLNSSHVKISYA